MSDYISREAAISTAIDAVDEWDGGANRERWAKINAALESIPAADVRPVVRGEWLRTPTFWAYCSVCGEEPPEETNITTNFCPNCGADMREES